MKELILIRHAKSQWSDLTVTDHDRDLKKRGVRDAKLMKQQMTVENLIPESVLVSSSKRTKATANILFGKNADIIQIFPELYEAECCTIEEIVQSQPESLNKIAIVGHNPTITELIQATGYEIENIPTCGIVQIRWNSSSWKECWFDRGVVCAILIPKMYR